MSELIISYSGIRGVVPGALDPEVAMRFGRAFGRMISERHSDPTVLLARDTRASGPVLLAALAQGLSPFARLIDLGVAPTPTLQHVMGAWSAAGGVCVTASHNPAEWNGMKFFLGAHPMVLDGEEMRALCAQASPEPHAQASHTQLDDRHDAALRTHREAVLAQVDVATVASRGLRVALDSGGGAGAEPTARLLEALGCAVVMVDSQRESEPTPERLGELAAAVLAEGCDAGLAQDLDADRLALVDERGTPAGEELTLVLAVDHLLRRPARGARTVVKNAATTRAVDDVVARHGAKLVETPVGEVHLSRALHEATQRGETAFGGEGNGGVIFPPVSLGRDSLVAAALVIESLALGATTLSARLAALPRYHMHKARIVAASVTFDELAQRAESQLPGARVSRADGLKLTLPDGSWLSLRRSNTEPVVRIVAESAIAGWAADAVAGLTSSPRC
jgi:phosphomannomutase